MEYIGDPIEQDELIALSGVGLCFPWKFNSDCDEVSVIPNIPMRTFGALGYESWYYSENIRPALLPGAVNVGTWPLPEGSYDPRLDGIGIPNGVKLFGLFGSDYNKMPAPENIDGYAKVSTLAELSGKAWCIVNAPSGYDYVAVSGAPDEDAGGRAYSKEFYLEKIKRSIDAGRPVVGFGLVTDVYACLITGYDGDALTISSYQHGVTQTSDWYEKCAGILVVGGKTGERLTGAAAYKCITDWALDFRRAPSHPVTANGVTYPQNEAAFTAMCEWLMDDDEWREITSHEAFLKQSGLLLVGYYRSNLYSYLKRMDEQYPGVVNPPVLTALDDMSKQFPGSHASDLWLNECVDPSITDFATLRDHAVREKVDSYVTLVSITDNRIQWALFMPDFVKKQVGDANVKVESFEYRRLPAMRFIGRETMDGDNRQEVFKMLDAMAEYRSGFDYDLLFQHHYGKPVDVEHWHGFWGRFMSAGAPVPEGFVSVDFDPNGKWEGPAGPPYVSQVAYAVFSGDVAEMHKSEGFDSDLMYDVTRNIVLGDDVCIDYPEKYWTAEVFRNGSDQPSDGYLFGINLDVFSKGI
jgi:hypothetical protein